MTGNTENKHVVSSNLLHVGQSYPCLSPVFTCADLLPPQGMGSHTVAYPAVLRLCGACAHHPRHVVTLQATFSPRASPLRQIDISNKSRVLINKCHYWCLTFLVYYGKHVFSLGFWVTCKNYCLTGRLSWLSFQDYVCVIVNKKSYSTSEKKEYLTQLRVWYTYYKIVIQFKGLIYY